MRMNCLQVSFRGLLFCFIAVKISSTETEKPGECPPERCFKSIGRVQQYCDNDSSCAGNKKCCSDNGYKVCKPPAQEREGSCPTNKPVTSPSCQCDDLCSSDSECPNGSKCCYNGCGMDCAPSIGEKNGFCGNEVNCFVAERSFCVNDSGCPNDEKCCQVTCSKMCTPPLDERPGTCPPMTMESQMPQYRTIKKSKNCASDCDCKSPYKCCHTMSGKSCTSPLNN